MDRRTMFEAAALAVIRQRRTEMATSLRATYADKQLKRAIRGMWALGDYHRFATELVWEVGQVLVDACGISPGQRLLDVAAGTGNVAIRAAEAGAQVVASDLTPENFEAGRR
jgi:2-polyprenyl-3-methyl-5-hydroxy-6-metoxy-1,4-benzoquinol methylase